MPSFFRSYAFGPSSASSRGSAEKSKTAKTVYEPTSADNESVFFLIKHRAAKREIRCKENTTARALFGNERDAGFADVFDIAVDGAARHAEFFREIRRGDGSLLLNGRNDADEAVGFQIKAPFYPQYSTPVWKTK